MAFDPLLVQIAVTSVALIFALSALQKLRDLLTFESAIEAYELAPAALVKPLTIALPILELGAAVTLVPEPTRQLGALLAMLVLTIVTLAIVLNLLRGRTDVACGCGGIEDEQVLSWSLVVRNLGLGTLVCTSFADLSLRVPLWLDYVSTLAGALACFGLYVLSNQLVANAPRLGRLRVAA
jgi:hypothetical protein